MSLFHADEFLSFPSPSSQNVPCSPTMPRKCSSPAPCVPDMDKMRHTLKHRFLKSKGLASPALNSIVPDQPSPTPRHVSTPVIVCSPKTPSSEQVVPSCSPFVHQEDTQKTPTQTPLYSGVGSEDVKNSCVQTPPYTGDILEERQCSQPQLHSILSKNSIPTDERPAVSKKRQNRTLDSPEIPAFKEINLFTQEKIFD